MAYDSDDERAYAKEAQPDKGSSEFFHDEVDEFHADREKVHVTYTHKHIMLISFLFMTIVTVT